MNLSIVKKAAKFAWVAAVLVFICIYAFKKRDVISSMLDSFSFGVLVVSFLFIVIAKLCLVLNMRFAAKHFGVNIPWLEAFRIYNLTQLGKYIPGSIWQFVGRISILREKNVPGSVIRDSLLAEHAWVVGSAASFGLLLIFITNPIFLYDWFGQVRWIIEYRGLLAAAVLVLGVSAYFVLVKLRLSSWLVALIPPLSALPNVFLIWVTLGASFWVTVIPFADPQPVLGYVIGMYSLAYVVGFLVPFAPAGLGVREAVLVFGMLPYMSSENAILLAAVSRILYFLVELTVSIPCIKKRFITSEAPKP